MYLQKENSKPSVEAQQLSLVIPSKCVGRILRISPVSLSVGSRSRISPLVSRHDYCIPILMFRFKRKRAAVPGAPEKIG